MKENQKLLSEAGPQNDTPNHQYSLIVVWLSQLIDYPSQIYIQNSQKNQILRYKIGVLM